MISRTKIKRKLYLGVARYFRFFATRSLRRWQPRVIAVTGSVGKTTLLNLLEVQLGERAHYSHNANSAYGIAFDVLGMDGIRGSKLKWIYLFIAAPLRSLWFRHSQEFYVVEIDGERPQETKFLADWLKPEVTMWVSVGRSHAVYFDAQVAQGLFASVEEAITHAFSALPIATSKCVIYNAESERIVAAMESEKITAKKVGIDTSVLQSYAVWPDRTEFRINGDTYRVTQPLPGEVYVQLAMMGALAEYLNEPVVHDLTEFVQPPGRSNFFEGKKNTKLIDSSYNAHLISMQSIIDMFEDMNADQKWVVIGDIIEQGEGEVREHERLGQLLAEANFDRYILVGRRTQASTYPLLDPTRTVTFLHPKDAAIYLEEELQGGETVVFKGSQYLEGVVEYLLKNPEDAVKLPRQEPAARARRAEWGLRHG